jgi:hypothetical protein
MLDHSEDLRTIHNASESLGNYFALVILSFDELVPPSKQKIPGDELEPRRERDRWDCYKSF